MPQLDYTLVFNQIFWLFFMFVSLYVIIFYYFLPTLFKIFKSRNQIFAKVTTEARTINKNLKSQTLFYKTHIKNCSGIINFIYSTTRFFKTYEASSLKPHLVPATVVFFVSAKVLFSQTNTNYK